MALSEKEKHLSLPFRKLARSPVRSAWSGISAKRAASPIGSGCKSSSQARWRFNIEGNSASEFKPHEASDKKESCTLGS